MPMLDILRKKAQSWVTYVLFGGLIIVFVLFFGYNTMQPSSGRDSIATVNGVPITQGEYDFAFDNNEAYYRQLFQDKMPERFLDGLRQSTLQQLINRKLMLEFARAHDVVVSDQELAEHLQALPFLQNDQKVFDPILYREQFLPGVAQQYHINFEVWAREGLLADKVRALITSSVYLSDDELKTMIRRERTRFTFEVVRFDPKQLVADKKFPDEKSVQEGAKAVQEVLDNTTARASLLETYGLTVETFGPMPATPELSFLAPNASPNTVREIFGLRPGERCANGPYHVEQSWVACRLLERSAPTPEELGTLLTEGRKSLEERYSQAFLEQWVQDLSARAKITRAL